MSHIAPISLLEQADSWNLLCLLISAERIRIRAEKWLTEFLDFFLFFALIRLSEMISFYSSASLVHTDMEFCWKIVSSRLKNFKESNDANRKLQSLSVLVRVANLKNVFPNPEKRPFWVKSRKSSVSDKSWYRKWF